MSYCLYNKLLKTVSTLTMLLFANGAFAATLDIYAAGTGGANMDIKINDKTVKTFTNVTGNYSNRQFTKYTYTTSQSLNIRDIKISYSNDASGRDLYVDRVVLDGTTYQTEAAETFSTGVYTNGKCQSSGGYFQNEKLSCNGYFAYNHKSSVSTPPSTSQTGSTIEMYAAGSGTADMTLFIDDVLATNFANVGGSPSTKPYKRFTYNTNAKVSVGQIKIAFLNDGGSNDLFVDKIVLDGKTYESEAAETYSVGVYKDGKCQNNGGYFKNEKLSCNGYFRYSGGGTTTPDPTPTPTPTPPSPSVTSTVQIYAAGNGSPNMQLLVNDVVVASFNGVKGNYSNRSFQNFSHTVNGTLSPDQIKVAFVNDSSTNDLFVDKITLNGVAYESESPGTYSTGVYTNGKCQSQGGYFQSEKLGCNGYFRYSNASGPVVVTPPPTTTPTANTLAAYGAARGIEMGAAMRWNVIQSGEYNYINTLQKEYGMIVPENDFKMTSIAFKQGTLKFETPDAIVDWAIRNSKKVAAHTLVWHHNVPDWLETSGMSNSQVDTWLQQYITTVVGRYKGKVQKWDVVNEPIRYWKDSATNTWKAAPRTANDSYWYKKLGAAYIEKAFRWANAADPQAKLFINEYTTEWNNVKTDELYKIVKGLKDKGVPIHGVGFQMHQRTDNSATYSQMYAAMKRFTDLGLDVELTEFEVAVALPMDNNKQTKQLQIYRDAVSACRALPRCKGITTWGFTDKYSWVGTINSAGGNTGAGYGLALPFDTNYNKKAVYNTIMDALK